MDDFTGTIQATGRDGVTRSFEYQASSDNYSATSYEDRREVWTFQVFSSDMKYVFQSSFMDEGNHYKQSMVAHDGCPEFVAMGMPEAFIREAFLKLSKPIRSSSNSKKTEGSESINYTAVKIWKRLEASGEAFQDEDGIYWYPVQR